MFLGEIYNHFSYKPMEKYSYAQDIQGRYLKELHELDYGIEDIYLHDDPKDNIDYLRRCLKRHKEHLDYMKATDREWQRLQAPFITVADTNLQDKLKTTPDAGLTKLPVLRINLQWFKKLWKKIK